MPFFSTFTPFGDKEQMSNPVIMEIEIIVTWKNSQAIWGQSFPGVFRPAILC